MMPKPEEIEPIPPDLHENDRAGTKTIKEPKEENLFLNLVLNIALPAIILSKMSGEDRLGPLAALILAISLPVFYGVYDYFVRRTFNLFSALGFASVLFTGGLGLYQATPQVFAIKEAVMPLLFATFVLLSHLWKEPFVNQILLNPKLMNLKKLETALEARGARAAFDGLLFHCSSFLAITLCCSGVANYFLAMSVLGGTEGGSPEYVEGIGKITWMGFLIIGIPMMLAMGGIFFYLLKGLQRVSGLDTDELTTPGETVKKRVSKGRTLSVEKLGESDDSEA